MWVRSACPRRGNISACAVTACLLAAWLAGPAEANGPIAGVATPVTAVQQAAGQAVTTVQSSAVRSSASPRSAARVSKARAAVAEPVVRTVAAVQQVSSTAGTTVQSASKGAATTARGAAEGTGTTARRAARIARTAAERAGSKPAFRAARERLVGTVTTGASYTASKVGQIGLTATPSGARGEAATTAQAVTPLSAVAGALTFVRPAIAADAGSPAATAPTADGGARLEPAARSGRDAAVLGAPASQPTGLTSGASSSAAAATAALVGLLGILVFASQRLGTLVRLRPASAPMPPFLALPERPG